MNVPSNRRPHLLRDILLLALAYVAFGLLARLPGAASAPFASAVWPPAGIALAVLLVRGPSRWPGVWLGSFCIDLARLWGSQASETALLIGALIATGATLQALLGQWLARRFLRDDLALDSVPAILKFFLLCGPLASLVSTSVGNAALWGLGGKPAEEIAVNWLFWWSGDTIGVLLMTPAVFALLGQPRAIWRPRRLSVALPLLFASGMVAVTFSIVSWLEHSNRQTEFERDAVLLANEVRSAFGKAEEAPLLLADLLRSGKQVDRTDFEQIARGIHTRLPAIQALEWIPRVPSDKLAAHERAMRSEGQGDYAVFERDAGGGSVPVATRGEHFPVSHVYPLEGNQAALGFDLGSEGVRRAALEEARRSKVPVASGRIRLVQEQGSQYGVLMFAPRFDAAGEVLLGYILAVVRIGRLVESTLRDDLHGGLALALSDLDAHGNETLLYESAGPTHAPVYSYAASFRFGSRLWQLSFSAAENYRFAHRAWYAWALLAGAVALSALLSFFLLVMSGRSVHTEQLVAERTAELEAARAKAEKSSQLLREAVGSIAQGFTIYDENDRLVICNDAYKQIYATSADLIVPGNTFEQIVRTGAERGQYAAALGRVDEWVKARVAQHQNARGEVIEQRLDDGRWLLIVEHRTPSGYIVGNRIDITTLKQATAAVEDRNVQLDMLFRLSPDGLVLYDQAGLGKFANPAFLRMTGLLTEDIVGQPLVALEERLRGLAENPEQWHGLDECFLGTGKVGSGETARGAARHLLALQLPRGMVLEFVGVTSEAGSVSRLLYVRDVTHEVEVDRMKSEFLSHAAHELRTPMASIFGFSELLISQEFDAATRKDLLETIHRQTVWLVDIINELLDLARIEARRGKDFKIEAVEVGALVAEVLAAMQIDATKWPVHCAELAGLPAVRADRAKLKEVFVNIIGNAEKYSPDGGRIEIAGEARTDATGLCLGISVRDHGIGMTTAQAARVCERFYRVDASGKLPGTGLGMSIVKEIMDLLGGHLEIASTPGQGTTVTLWLPAIAGTPETMTGNKP
jgi:signal transduction histidine kinase/CHASE1-domain containing sensor protein